MNPVGANLSHQLAQKQVQDARLLAQDTKKGQVTTATTVGRAVNQTTQDVKQATVEVPKEKVSLSSAQAQPQSDAQDRSQLGQESDVSSVYSQAQAPAQPEGSRSSEALMGFSATLFGLENGNKKELEEIITQSAGVDTSQMAVGDSGREVALAATALRTAVSKLQAKMPGATAEQIREAAKSDPEVAKWASVADSANSYLTEIKAESQAAAHAGSQAAAGGVPGGAAASSDGTPIAGASISEPGAGTGENPFKLDPEKQAQMMAENVKTMEAIQNIYAQMWAEIQKARAQRHQLMMETATAVNAMLMESHVNRMKSSENHRKAMMSVILENYK